MSNTFTEDVLERLAARALRLPDPMAPAGLYEPCRLDRGTGYLAAQFPVREGCYVVLGRVGHELSIVEGREAASLAALHALARIEKELAGFDRLRGLLRVDGFVASADDFVDQPNVLDGASELLSFVLGVRGRHARTAFAVPRLPRNNSVELIVTFSYDE